MEKLSTSTASSKVLQIGSGERGGRLPGYGLQISPAVPPIENNGMRQWHMVNVPLLPDPDKWRPYFLHPSLSHVSSCTQEDSPKSRRNGLQIPQGSPLSTSDNEEPRLGTTENLPLTRTSQKYRAGRRRLIMWRKGDDRPLKEQRTETTSPRPRQSDVKAGTQSMNPSGHHRPEARVHRIRSGLLRKNIKKR